MTLELIWNKKSNMKRVNMLDSAGRDPGRIDEVVEKLRVIRQLITE